MEDSNNRPEAAAAKPVATASGSNSNAALPPAAAARYRLSQRQAESHEPSPSPRRPTLSPLARRRSSLLSYSSIDDIRQAFADDIVNPKTTNAKTQADENEVTHWHSTPLAFAFLPALGGLLFKDGKAFTSDLLLLGLAAVFLNWSIRLPWDWYYSAQALRRDIEPDNTPAEPEDVVDDAAVETASSVGGSPVLTPRRRRSSAGKEQIQDNGKREEAAANLRTQETLALAATFVFPLGAAYLLHVIRAQLSSTSTGLVSDYNLSIFLLAAEIRPCRQVVRLVANRTLYLQRIVAGVDDPFSSALEDKSSVSSLVRRVAELEAKFDENTVTTSSGSIAQKADVSDLSIELRKRYEPRLEGLERAVRRYEKRSTTLAIATEQRLQSLEHRIQEALSLAAVAAQHSRDRGALSKSLDSAYALVTWPIKTTLDVAMSPLLLLDDLYGKLKALLLGGGTSRSGRRKATKHGGPGGNDKMQEKAPLRRAAK